jgi:hypothetical protein
MWGVATSLDLHPDLAPAALLDPTLVAPSPPLDPTQDRLLPSGLLPLPNGAASSPLPLPHAQHRHPRVVDVDPSRWTTAPR